MPRPDRFPICIGRGGRAESSAKLRGTRFTRKRNKRSIKELGCHGETDGLRAECWYTYNQNLGLTMIGVRLRGRIPNATMQLPVQVTPGRL